MTIVSKKNVTGWPYVTGLTLGYFFKVKIFEFFYEILGIYISEYVFSEYISLFTITLPPSLLQAIQKMSPKKR